MKKEVCPFCNQLTTSTMCASCGGDFTNLSFTEKKLIQLKRELLAHVHNNHLSQILQLSQNYLELDPHWDDATYYHQYAKAMLDNPSAYIDYIVDHQHIFSRSVLNHIMNVGLIDLESCKKIIARSIHDSNERDQWFQLMDQTESHTEDQTTLFSSITFEGWQKPDLRKQNATILVSVGSFLVVLMYLLFIRRQTIDTIYFISVLTYMIPFLLISHGIRLFLTPKKKKWMVLVFMIALFLIIGYLSTMHVEIHPLSFLIRLITSPIDLVKYILQRTIINL